LSQAGLLPCLGLKNDIGWDSKTKQILAGGFHTPYGMAVSVKLFHNPSAREGSVSELRSDLDRDTGRMWYDIFNADSFWVDALYYCW
jgi:hypothetical protein